MNKRTEFKFRFKDDTLNDWRMTLITKEPMDEVEIENLVRQKCEEYQETKQLFCPVDVFDDICNEYGWNWRDTDYDEIYLSQNQWKGY